MRRALTIAGSDPSGGAGVQADLKTFAAHGVYGFSAITAITVQNSLGVSRVDPLPPDLVVAQVDAVVADFGVDVIKIGMLATSEIASAVADAVTRLAPPQVVLDPVLASSGGISLSTPDTVDVIRDRWLGLASVITANALEAATLTGLPVQTVADARRAARTLIAMGARAVIVKGGHLDGAPVDVVDDGRTVVELGGERLAARHAHGTGCTFAAALAARLALGRDLLGAAADAKRYVAQGLANAPGLGHGSGPLFHGPATDE